MLCLYFFIFIQCFCFLKVKVDLFFPYYFKSPADLSSASSCYFLLVPMCQKRLLSIFCSPPPVLWFPSSCCIPDCSLGLPQSCVRIFLLAILTSGLENVIPWIDPHLSVTVTAWFFFCDLAVFEEFPVLQNRGTLYSIHIQN